MSTIRVAAHVHSDWSYDGSVSLRDLAHAFGRRGYDAVLVAEHDRGFDDQRWTAHRAACARASTSRTVLVPGIEYSDAANAVHVPVWGASRFLGEGRETLALLRAARAARGFALLAHPSRRSILETLDPAILRAVDAIELWNRKYDGYAPSREAGAVLARQPGLLPFVSLDFHTARQFHPLAMLLDIEGAPSEASVCRALACRRARPKAFGIDARRLADGAAAPAIRGLERGRRHAARPIRALRGRRAARA